MRQSNRLTTKLPWYLGGSAPHSCHGAVACLMHVVAHKEFRLQVGVSHGARPNLFFSVEVSELICCSVTLCGAEAHAWEAASCHLEKR